MARPKEASYRTAPVLFGKWLRKMRQDKRVPIRAVAAAAAMDQAHLSKVELGQRLPTEAQAAAIARYFGVPVEELEARRIAESFRQRFANNPAAAKAVEMLQDVPWIAPTTEG